MKKYLSIRPPCNLEVQVNGEHTFFLRKRILLARCGRLARNFKGALASTGDRTTRVHSYRVVVHDLPGGYEAFESVARFCYSSGNLAITTTNVAMLRCVAEFLEMTEDYGQNNLIRQTEVLLSNMSFWSWRECLTFLKTCEAVLPLAEKTQIIQRCVDSLAAKAATCSSFSSPISSSPDSVVPRDSLDTRSSEGVIKRVSSRSWWSEDMSSLSMYLIERIVKAMVAHNVDNKLVSKFLLHYLQSSLPMLGYTAVCPRKKWDPDEETLHKYSQKVQREVLETVVSLIYSLERASVTCKSLFGLRRVATIMNASRHCRKQIEEMIGSQLDKASLDNLLVSAHPPRSSCLYDVDLIQRLVQLFLESQSVLSALDNLQIVRGYPASSTTKSSLKTVGSLIDLYLAEIAADPNLKAPKFQAIAEALPDNARDSYDALYRALDIYLEAHPKVSADEAVRLCKIINFQKLSYEACKHVAHNPRFPARLALQVLLLQQVKLRNAIDGILSMEDFSNHGSSRFDIADEVGEQMVLYSREMDYSSVVRQNDELKSYLEKMQSRVVELEKICRRMRSQMSKHLRIRHFLC